MPPFGSSSAIIIICKLRPFNKKIYFLKGARASGEGKLRCYNQSLAVQQNLLRTLLRLKQRCLTCLTPNLLMPPHPHPALKLSSSAYQVTDLNLPISIYPKKTTLKTPSLLLSKYIPKSPNTYLNFSKNGKCSCNPPFLPSHPQCNLSNPSNPSNPTQPLPAPKKKKKKPRPNPLRFLPFFIFLLYLA